MDARETVEAYYDALGAGDPLGPFFARPREGDDAPVKYGISERLVGIEAIRSGLREQTRTTTDWRVESRALRVTERERHAWLSDAVSMAWTDAETGERQRFEARWSATMERAGASEGPPWRFVGMHVSTADEL